MILLLFKNTRAVIKAESIISSFGITPIVRPVPVNISSECGMCIEIKSFETFQCEDALKGASIFFKKVEL